MTNPINWHKKHVETLDFGGRLADFVAKGMGSWKFIIFQSVFVILWMGINVVGYFYHWDAYPFILLNLLFSTQAAYAAPIIMMSQNMLCVRDRLQAQADYQLNIEAKQEIEYLATVLSRLETEKLDKIIAMLEDLKK
mgnify:FL=1